MAVELAVYLAVLLEPPMAALMDVDSVAYSVFLLVDPTVKRTASEWVAYLVGSSAELWAVNSAGYSAANLDDL